MICVPWRGSNRGRLETPDYDPDVAHCTTAPSKVGAVVHLKMLQEDALRVVR